jgi:hypothetical protein
MKYRNCSLFIMGYLLAFFMAGGMRTMLGSPSAAWAANSQVTGGARALHISPADSGGLIPAILAAYHAGLKTVVIPPGVYRLPEPKGRFYIHLRAMHNFTIVGTGVTLLRTDPSKGCLNLTNCEHVTLTGFTIRCDPLPFTQGTVVSLSPHHRSMVVRVAKGYLPLNSPQLPPASKKAYSGAQELFCNDVVPATRRFKLGTGDILLRRCVPMGSRLFRLYCKQPQPAVQPGDYLVFGGKIMRDIRLFKCSHIVLTNVTVEGGTGFAYFEELGNGYNIYDHCNIVYPPKPAGATQRPLMSTCADGLHSTCVRHGPTIIGCHFEGMNDDGIAIHGLFAVVLRTASRHWVVSNEAGNDFRPGDPLQLYDPHGAYIGTVHLVAITAVSGIKSSAKVLRTMKGASRYAANGPFFDIHVHPALAAFPACRISDPAADGSGFVIRNCVIKNNRGHGMVIKASDGLIEDNRIAGCMYTGIAIMPEFWWDEAGFSSHILIRHNTFRGNMYGPALMVSGPTGPRAMAFGHRDIVIENNRFQDDGSANLSLGDSQDVKILKNDFIDPHCGRGNLITLQDCRKVLLQDNHVIHPGPAMEKLVGVGPDVSSVKGINTGVKVQAKR